MWRTRAIAAGCARQQVTWAMATAAPYECQLMRFEAVESGIHSRAYNSRKEDCCRVRISQDRLRYCMTTMVIPKLPRYTSGLSSACAGQC